MKKTLKIISGVAVLSATSFLAQGGDFSPDEKDLKKIIEDQGIYLQTAKEGIVLSGYVDTSYTYQFGGKVSPGQITLREGGNDSPFPSTEAQGRRFDVDNNDFNINAFKLALEKALPEENTWAAGFRADLIFGEDAQILAGNTIDTPVGDNASYFFLEQAYVTFRAPVGNGLDFKFGKFVTLLGYEVIESPANLNFSRGLLFTNALPLTHTGFLMAYAFSEQVDVQIGLVNGWNNSDTGAFGGISGFGKAVTGQIAFHAPGGNATLVASAIYSIDGESGASGLPVNRASGQFYENEDVLTVDIWGQWAPRFAQEKLLLAFEGVFGFANHGGFDAAFIPIADLPGVTLSDSSRFNDTWYGGALYAKYQFNPVFSLAARAEYLHDSHGYKLGIADDRIDENGLLFFSSRPIDIFSWTLTAGFDIWENLLMRVEYRYDHFSRGKFFNDLPLSAGLLEGTSIQENNDQHQIALNLVYTF